MGEHGISRRDVIRIGFGAAAAVAGGKLISAATRDTRSPIQIEATAQAKLPDSERYEKLVPKWLLERTGKIKITAQEPYGIIPKQEGGTVIKYFEKNSMVALLTAEHIGATYNWRGITLEFPYARNNPLIPIDARLNAKNWATATPDDWAVLYHSPHSSSDLTSLHPIRLIVAQKSLGSLGGQTQDDEKLLQAYPGVPQKGEKVYILGYPEANKGQLAVNELTFERVTKPEEVQYAGIPLWEFRGLVGSGYSGAPIITKDGLVVAIHSGAELNDPTRAVAIPFNQFQPIQEINDALKVLKP
jgi:hypothetical protein